ncbi:hypothetical protein K439DRAFT_1642875 [Ramaria rubella]|nr:hypothetical protein K439DRAFT_1642875 [Ramaria rubella]
MPQRQVQSLQAGIWLSCEETDLRYDMTWLILGTGDDFIDRLLFLAEKQQKSWTSDVYDHFRMPLDIRIDGESVRYIFVCKTQPSKSVACSDSTSNLVSHKERCSPVAPAGSFSIKSFTYGTDRMPSSGRRASNNPANAL